MLQTWRLMADIMNDLATCLTLISPLWPNQFLILACAGSFCRAIGTTGFFYLKPTPTDRHL